MIALLEDALIPPRTLLPPFPYPLVYDRHGIAYFFSDEWLHGGLQIESSELKTCAKTAPTKTPFYAVLTMQDNMASQSLMKLPFRVSVAHALASTAAALNGS